MSYSEEGLSQSDDNIYFSSQINQSNEEDLPNKLEFWQKEEDNCHKTEFEEGNNIYENNEDKNTNISEEKKNPSTVDNLISNKNHSSTKNKKNKKKNNKKNINNRKKSINCSNRTLINKKRGRRNKNSTETGGHTAKDKDNQIRKMWRIFLNCILDLVNSLSKPYGLAIKPTNFAQQFGPSIIENEDFIKLQFYQFYTYNTIFKNNEKNEKHQDIGKQNEKVIQKMIFKEKHQTYIAIMKSRIEKMYKKFIINNKSITLNGKTIQLLNFKTIDDIIKEHRKKLNGKSVEIEKDLQDFRNNAISLVDQIKIKGKEIKRKKEKIKIKKYLIIPELKLNEEEEEEFNFS